MRAHVEPAHLPIVISCQETSTTSFFVPHETLGERHQSDRSCEMRFKQNIIVEAYAPMELVYEKDNDRRISKEWKDNITMPAADASVPSSAY